MKLKNESASEIGKIFFYRIFCILALIFAIYLMTDLALSGSLDVKVIMLFLILLLVIVFGLYDWAKSYSIQKKQTEELKIYKLYIKPLEELTKDIRMHQHEFDNHMNAILNMHLTIDNYEELVAAQNAYAKEIYTDKGNRYTSLLKVSDKIFAGFIYSKLVSAPEYLDIDVQVLSKDIISEISEHSLIEVIGTLIDNAFEASDKEHNKIRMIIDGHEDKINFSITNQVENLTLAQVSRFFERGYTTKKNKEGHGLGLYQAREIAHRYNGDITIELMDNEGKQELCFRVEI